MGTCCVNTDGWGLNVGQAKVKFSQVWSQVFHVYLQIGEALTPLLVKWLPSINKVTDCSLRAGVIGMLPGDAPLWETARPGRFWCVRDASRRVSENPVSKYITRQGQVKLCDFRFARVLSKYITRQGQVKLCDFGFARVLSKYITRQGQVKLCDFGFARVWSKYITRQGQVKLCDFGFARVWSKYITRQGQVKLCDFGFARVLSKYITRQGQVKLYDFGFARVLSKYITRQGQVKLCDFGFARVLSKCFCHMHSLCYTSKFMLIVASQFVKHWKCLKLSLTFSCQWHCCGRC